MNCMDVGPVECMLALLSILEALAALVCDWGIKKEVKMKELLNIFIRGSALMERVDIGISDSTG